MILRIIYLAQETRFQFITKKNVLLTRLRLIQTSYRNQSINLLGKLTDWFLYDGNWVVFDNGLNF